MTPAVRPAPTLIDELSAHIEPVTADPLSWNRRSVLHQRWDELAFFHWPFDPADVQRLLPDVQRSMIVGVARTVFSLPYCFAHARHTVDGADHVYTLHRRRPHAARPTAEMRFTVGERIPDDDVDDLDHFLTARGALVTTRFGRLRYGAVTHVRWPLHRLDAVEIDQNVIEAGGLPSPVGEPIARYSPGVRVDVAWFEPVR